jgi:excisionase family DNA binding protein
MTGGIEYLRAADIARLLGVSIRTVRRWIDDKIIPSAKLGGARLVSTVELARLLSPQNLAPENLTEADDESSRDQATINTIGKA